MSNHQDIVLDLLYGRWRSQTLYAGVKLGIFDMIGDEPLLAEGVARELNLDPALLYRLLRALGSLGLLEENSDHCFSITQAGALLQKGHPQSLRDVLLLREGPEHTAVWKHLPDIVRAGQQNGFVCAFGHTAFDYAAHEPAYAETFDAGMSSHSRLQTAWVLEALRGYDFAAIRHLCDVGGGRGHLLGHLLVQYPHLVGTLLERASTIHDTQALWPEKLRVGGRCQYVAGDMFADVPSADAYIMKMVLHDWNDNECVQILRNLHERAPAAGRVFIVEHVISETITNDYATLFDMHMMCWGTGKERTAQEYASLLQQAGWTYMAIWFPPNGAIGVIESTKA